MLREALNVPDELHLRCCGITKLKKYCTKPISKANRTSIKQLLSDAVAAGSWSAAQQFLTRLAQLVLCQGPHQVQGSKLLCSWQEAFAEAEKRPSAGEPVTKITVTPTDSAAIKHEPVYIHRYIAATAKPEVSTKSEPEDEERDLSSLSEVQEETRPTHVFVPYGKPRTQHKINKIIKGMLGKPLSPTEKKSLSKSGVVYTYKFAEEAGSERPHLKIGYTDDLDRRQKEWKRKCGYEIKRVSYTPANLYPRVERLVHAQLWARRKREEQCLGCGGGHKEFFEMRLHEVNAVIGLWAEWMEHNPYDEYGLLKTEWQEKLQEVDLNDPNCWETFTAKF